MTGDEALIQDCYVIRNGRARRTNVIRVTKTQAITDRGERFYLDGGAEAGVPDGAILVPWHDERVRVILRNDAEEAIRRWQEDQTPQTAKDAGRALTTLGSVWDAARRWGY